MRIALVGQWLRAAVEDPGGRPVALRFAVGITVVQLLWVVRLAIGPPWGYAAIVVLGIAELAIPVWAERSGRHTPWHADHIAERYGLFTIIVLGECVLAATTAVDAAIEAGGVSAALVILAIGGLLLVFGLWWSYFKHRSGIDERLSLRAAIAWGYGHYFVFAAVAAMGAGLQVAADSILGDADIGIGPVALTVGGPRGRLPRDRGVAARRAAHASSWRADRRRVGRPSSWPPWARARSVSRSRSWRWG